MTPDGPCGQWSSLPPLPPSSPRRLPSQAPSPSQSKPCSLAFSRDCKVLHTSKIEGQIYVPVINWGLCIGVVALTLVFGSATKLGDIYGVAVTGTFILNTVLFLAVARFLWGTAKRKLAPVAVLFLTVEVAFFSSNIAKVEHGAWLPLGGRVWSSRS